MASNHIPHGTEVIITTYGYSIRDDSIYSYLIRKDDGQEILDAKLIKNCNTPGKAELIAILAALRTLSEPSLVLLYPHHKSYLSQEFSNLENGIVHLAKPDIFDELTQLFKYHDILIEYSKNTEPETDLLRETALAVMKETLE